MAREKGEGEKSNGKKLRKSQEVDRVGTGEKKKGKNVGKREVGKSLCLLILEREQNI